MDLSIHRIVVFVWDVLYRTWVLLWKRVVVFMGSMGRYARVYAFLYGNDL